MTLKKDALIAVSLAGVVLSMAGLSSRVGGGPMEDATEGQVLRPHSRKVLELFIDTLNARVFLDASEATQVLSEARRATIALVQRREIQSPIDRFRAASILKSATDPNELELAHELSLSALAQGVAKARRLVFECQDRLLLSAGQSQRYGTQLEWNGRSLARRGQPSRLLTPSLQDDLRLDDVGERSSE